MTLFPYTTLFRSREVAAVFVKFRGCLETVAVDDFKFVVEHPQFPSVLKGLSSWDRNQRCLRILTQQMQRYSLHDGLSRILEFATNDISHDTLQLFLPLVQHNYPLSPGSIEQFLTLIYTDLTSTRHGTSGHDEVHKYCRAVELANVIFEHPSVRRRIDPLDDIYLSAAILFVTGRFYLPATGGMTGVSLSDRDVQMLTACRSLITLFCRISDNRVMRILRQTLGHMANDGERALYFGAILDNEGLDAMVEEFKIKTKTICWAREDGCIGCLLALVDGAEIPDWAKQFFVRSAAFFRWGSTWSRPFFKKIAGALTIEQVVEFIRIQYSVQGPQTSKEWQFAAMVFDVFAENRKQLLEAFPIKSKPSFAYDYNYYADQIFSVGATRSIL
jgi:hypothetical protein